MFVFNDVGLNSNVSEYKDLSLQELKIEADEWHQSLGVGGGEINYKEKGEKISGMKPSEIDSLFHKRYNY